MRTGASTGLSQTSRCTRSSTTWSGRSAPTCTAGRWEVPVSRRTLSGRVWSTNFRLFVVPAAVGSGKPALPRDVRLELELLDELPFEGGFVHLRYGVTGGAGP